MGPTMELTGGVNGAPVSAAALAAKKKIKHHYGITEQQLRHHLAAARRHAGDIGVALMQMCERRLDNVLCRAGLTQTHLQARQGIIHGHFQVNGRKVTRPGFLVRAGDVIAALPRPSVRAHYRPQAADPAVGWLHVEPAELQVTVTRLPAVGDVGLDVDAGRVVELLTRQPCEADGC